MQRAFVNAKNRWVAAGYPNYAPWVPLFFHGFTALSMLLAVSQRVPGGNGLPTAGLVAIAALTYAIGEVLGPRFHWAVFAVAALVPLGVITAAYPVDFDFNLFTIALLVGRFGALEPVRRSAAVFLGTLAGVAVVSLTGQLNGAGFTVAVILAGWDIGWLMRTQQRRIDEQAREQEQRAVKAALEERQRIAREVHDVIAHSLSVTMLHLTAARRILEEGDDVPEAIDALRDAERQGRQAMSDIRQTVGLLGSASGEITSTPDLADLPELVRGFRDAGLQISLEVRGDLAKVPATTGLSMFRIAQESLSNVAKHQPHAAARISVDVRNGQRLVVANDLCPPVHYASDDGAGVRGMAERAELLGADFSAGARGDEWVVELEVAGVRTHLGRFKCALGLAPRSDRGRPQVGEA